jgi:hypothetical protein
MTYWKNFLREVCFLSTLCGSIDTCYCKYNLVCLRAVTSFQHDNQAQHILQREILLRILSTIHKQARIHTHTHTHTYIYIYIQRGLGLRTPRFTNNSVYEPIFRAKTPRVTNGVSDYEHNLATAAN